MSEVTGAASLSRLLGELEQAMIDAGADHTLAHLQQGLDEGAVRSRLAGIGLAAPDEVVAWFAWHDGSAGYPVLPGSEFYSLSSAISEYEQADRIAGDPIDGDSRWCEGWLPLIHAGNMDRVVADCRQDTRAATIRRVAYDSGMFSDDSILSAPQPSLCVMLSWWLDALRSGAYAWNAKPGDWTWDRFDRIPPERRGLC